MTLKLNLFGFGFKKEQNIKRKIGCNLNKNDLKLNRLKQISLKKSNLKSLGSILKNKQLSIISFEKRLKTYRGLRNKNKLPCRGQRTHTNAKTKKKMKY